MTEHWLYRVVLLPAAIARGYDFPVVAFALVFVLPLFTYGFYLLWKTRS